MFTFNKQLSVIYLVYLTFSELINAIQLLNLVKIFSIQILKLSSFACLMLNNEPIKCIGSFFFCFQCDVTCNLFCDVRLI